MVDLEVSSELDLPLSEILPEGSNSVYCEIVSPDADLLVSKKDLLVSENIDGIDDITKFGEVLDSVPVFGRAYTIFHDDVKTVKLTPFGDYVGIVVFNFGTFRN